MYDICHVYLFINVHLYLHTFKMNVFKVCLKGVCEELSNLCIQYETSANFTITRTGIFELFAVFL